MRQETGAKEGTEITKKGGMVVREISVEGNPVNRAHIHAGIIPVHKNHADVEVTHIPENHANIGTILILESHGDAEVTLIPKNHVDIGTVHVHAGMLTGVRIPQGSDVPTTQLWTL